MKVYTKKLRIKYYNVLIALFFLLAYTGCKNTRTPQHISPNKVIPTEKQVKYQQLELIGFIHFSLNTFTNKEWGYGDESPALFNPSNLNTDQWASVAKKAGMKQLILTAKHHDGFCLWPSKYTEHSIKNSPYKDGNGDIVKEFVESCRKYGLKVGLYVSPWDRNHEDYGGSEYITYYRNQLRELLTGYGKINEIWFDGANGGSGYYGGARETRTIDKKTYYEWDETIRLVKKWQPGILVFSDAGPDIRWVGNEKGFAGRTFWSTIERDSLVIGASDKDYLNTGDPNGNAWITGQCDVSIRPGWFYHQHEDSLVKSPRELMDIYYKSIGRNAVLLINLPPDKRGLIHEKDSLSLNGFRKIRDKTFDNNLAQYGTCNIITNRIKKTYPPGHMIDQDPGTYWAASSQKLPVDIILSFPEQKRFNTLLLQEPIRFGQRISAFKVHVMNDNDHWNNIFQGTTIGYKRIVRFENTAKTKSIKIEITSANNNAAISNIELFLADEDIARDY